MLLLTDSIAHGISCVSHAGSHDIVETGVHVNPLRIHTQYLLDSQAAGGLFSFLFIDANGVIDFRKSTYLCLEKNTSQSYVLPFTQSPELYVISAYDIEEDGLLYSGEAYPATTSTHVISGPGNPKCILLLLWVYPFKQKSLLL